MKKSIILIAAAVLCALGAQAQRFDWAKGYGSSMANSGCSVQGSLTDSAGNLYILGQYRFDSRWEDEYIRPPETYFNPETKNLLIAKITPDGTMAWKKMVQASGNNDHSFAYDIKPLGDTGFAVMFNASNSAPGLTWLYWLDSLHMDDRYPLNSYQYSDRRFTEGRFNAWLAFDFDGHVKEQYIIQLSGVDTGGNDIMIQPYLNRPDSLPFLVMNPMQRPSFDVDSAGNIYICRDSYDKIGASTHYYQPGDSLAAIKVWVNHREVGMFPVEDKPIWVPHLLKFAPHFDTLLNSRYVVQHHDSIIENIENKTYLRIDQSSLFLIHNITLNCQLNNTIVFDSINNVSVPLNSGNTFKGIITIHDLNLYPQIAIHLKDSIINQSRFFANSPIKDICFDHDSNLIFIYGTSARSYENDIRSTNSLFIYRNIPLTLNDDVYVLSLTRNNYAYHSLSIFPSTVFSTLSLYATGRCIPAQRNRVFFQGIYSHGFNTPTDTFYTPNPSYSGLALAVFDYQGHLIDGIDYNTFAIDNKPGSIALRDSNLYLATHLKADADFGEHHVYAAGYDPFVCIAKYVDASFMTPYVYVPPTVPEDSSGVRVIQMDDACRVYPNPATNRLTVATEEPLVTVKAVSMEGVEVPLKHTDAVIDINPLPSGIYFLEIVTQNQKYHKKIIKQ